MADLANMENQFPKYSIQNPTARIHNQINKQFHWISDISKGIVDTDSPSYLSERNRVTWQRPKHPPPAKGSCLAGEIIIAILFALYSLFLSAMVGLLYCAIGSI